MMVRLIRSEILKLVTVRLPAILLGATAALTVLIAVLIASRAGGGRMAPAPLDTADGLTQVITVTNFGLILAMVLGAIVSSGEFRTTATATYLATSRRWKVLVAKLFAASLAGLVFGAVAAGAATATGLIWVSAKGYDTSLSAGTMLEYAAGAAVGAALLAALGVGVGTLIRNTVVASVGILVWALVIEHIGGGLFSSVAPYLPFTAASTLAGQALEGEAVALSSGAAATLLVAVAALVAVVGARTVLRRDIA